MNQNNKLERVQNTLSLSQKMRDGLAQIREEKHIIKQQEGIIFLLDVSGSMSDYVDDKPKIAHLREVMQDYQANRKVSFSGRIYESQIPEPQSNTNMALGFQHLQTIIPKPISVVLISDGEPDNPENAIVEAIKLHTPINIVFIGDKGSRGEQFMIHLASLTGGKQFTAQTNVPQFRHQLKTGIVAMLPEGKE